MWTGCVNFFILKRLWGGGEEKVAQKDPPRPDKPVSSPRGKWSDHFSFGSSKKDERKVSSVDLKNLGSDGLEAGVALLRDEDAAAEPASTRKHIK